MKRKVIYITYEEKLCRRKISKKEKLRTIEPFKKERATSWLLVPAARIRIPRFQTLEAQGAERRLIRNTSSSSRSNCYHSHMTLRFFQLIRDTVLFSSFFS
jgi:hypothetical protein